MTYAQVITNAADAAFIDRVRAALVAAAIAISVDAPVGDVNIRRDRLARICLHEPLTWAQRFALAVGLQFKATKNDLLPASVTDGELDTQVAAVFNDFLPL